MTLIGFTPRIMIATGCTHDDAKDVERVMRINTTPHTLTPDRFNEEALRAAETVMVTRQMGVA